MPRSKKCMVGGKEMLRYSLPLWGIFFISNSLALDTHFSSNNLHLSPVPLSKICRNKA